MNTNRTLKNTYGLAAGVTLAAPVHAASIGALSAGLAPWMLLGIPAVAALWWLMKSTPMKPVRQIFPGISLLYNLKTEEQTPTRMPWWQYIPITLAAASVIGALAKPEWNQQQTPLSGSGPVMLVVDNGWAAARHWKARTEQLDHLIARAERAGRTIMIIPTAAPQDGSPIAVQGPVGAAEARQLVARMKAHPWPANREAALKALSGLENKQQTSVIWLSDGLSDKGAAPLTQKLQTFGTLTVIEDEKNVAPRLIDQPAGSTENLTIAVRRSQSVAGEDVTLTATDDAGNPLDSAVARFKAGESKAEAIFKLPPAIGNEVTSITIEGDNNAGARVLIDERFRRRPVGVIQTGQPHSAQTLLNESDYVGQALGPYVDLHQGTIDELLKRKLAVVVMADSAPVGSAQSRNIDTWVREGGTLLRFAGPRLAEQSPTTPDTLLPLKLRSGSRTLGGSVSGGKEGKIAPFAPGSPFAGLTLPDNISIKQQVLPQPGLDNDDNTWARLQDGTPLVTARKHGSGQIILMHTTADPQWGNVAYSGLFVDMLRAIVATSQGVAGKLEGGEISLPPVKVMDGQGRLSTPTDAVRPLTGQAITDNEVSPRHPPGFYGNQSMKQAHNLSVAVPELKALGDLPGAPARKIYEAGKKDLDLTGYLWAGAFSFLLLDLGIMLWQRRGTRATPRKTAAAPMPGQ